jgi:hypothetical protein
MFTIIVTATTFIVLCGLYWHDQPATVRKTARRDSSQIQKNE